ncbi:hypothetical protein [Gelatiniphilus marinus]|uniref:DUF4258 domain-containing protein n=1 Tax=Gelatiniphilus marinus TaxID=1759464 RepID=A0ABW5JR88_9FLAO
MKLIQRIGYYLGGFSLGLIILAFFLNGKKVSCNYGPQARVIKRINTKPLQFSPDILKAISSEEIDTNGLKVFMIKGDIDFGNSKAQQKPCATYMLEGELNTREAQAIIVFCHNDSIATLTNLSFK